MTKSELRTGMIVTYRDGRTRNVFLNTHSWGDCLASKDSWVTLNDFNEDLTHKSHRVLDIVKVEESCIVTDLVNDNPFILKTIWTRPKPKKLTVSEIEAILGYPVEIVADT